jgi:hypothetical protein
MHDLDCRKKVAQNVGYFCKCGQTIALASWSTYIVVSFSRVTKEIGAMGRELESRHGVGFKKYLGKKCSPTRFCQN